MRRQPTEDCESIPFSEIETVLCPKCSSSAGNKCHVLAGKNVSYKTKTSPHMERVFAFLNKKEAEEGVKHEASLASSL